MKSTILACLLPLFSLVAASHVEPQTIPVKHTHESKIQNPSIEEKAELTEEESLPQLPEEKTEDLTEGSLPSFPVACFPNGAMRCDGQGFLTCVWGKWVKRNCGPGTKCIPVGASVTCGRKVVPPILPCSPNGAMRCDGQGFLTCVWGNWVKRDCGPGTKCIPVGSSLTCGY